MEWLKLTSKKQFDEVLNKHHHAVILKHSTRCPISRMAYSRIERDWTSDEPVYCLDLLRYRDLSEYIEEKSGVMHESPQVIVFQNGEAVYHSSHSAIRVEKIEEFLQ